MLSAFFFFSSRRLHTRSYGDWSSDVCSSDLSRHLGIEPPDVMPRATEHIPEMVALIRRLEDRGYTYRRDGSIYFRISKFPGYGKLSKTDFAGMQVGAS